MHSWGLVLLVVGVIGGDSWRGHGAGGVLAQVLGMVGVLLLEVRVVVLGLSQSGVVKMVFQWVLAMGFCVHRCEGVTDVAV